MMKKQILLIGKDKNDLEILSDQILHGGDLEILPALNDEAAIEQFISNSPAISVLSSALDETTVNKLKRMFQFIQDDPVIIHAGSIEEIAVQIRVALSATSNNINVMDDVFGLNINLQ